MLARLSRRGRQEERFLKTLEGLVRACSLPCWVATPALPMPSMSSTSSIWERSRSRTPLRRRRRPVPPWREAGQAVPQPPAFPPPRRLLAWTQPRCPFPVAMPKKAFIKMLKDKEVVEPKALKLAEEQKVELKAQKLAEEQKEPKEEEKIFLSKQKYPIKHNVMVKEGVKTIPAKNPNKQMRPVTPERKPAKAKSSVLSVGAALLRPKSPGPSMSPGAGTPTSQLPPDWGGQSQSPGRVKDLVTVIEQNLQPAILPVPRQLPCVQPLPPSAGHVPVLGASTPVLRSSAKKAVSHVHLSSGATAVLP